MLKNSKALMKVIKITDRLLFSIHDQEGVKLPLRLILKFSYLKKQKFSHKCKILWALCVGAYQKILSWSNLELFNSLYGIDIKKNKYKEDSAIAVLISFALDKYHSNANRKILFHKIACPQATKIFGESVLLPLMLGFELCCISLPWVSLFFEVRNNYLYNSTCYESIATFIKGFYRY